MITPAASGGATGKSHWYYNGSAGYIGERTYAGNFSTDWTLSSIVMAGGTNNVSTLKRWSDGATADTWNASSYSPTAGRVLLGQRYDDGYTGNTIATDWEWLIIRKHVATLPTVTIGAEQ